MSYSLQSSSTVKGSVTATSSEQADAAIARLSSRKHTWVQVSVGDRMNYLRRCIQSVQAVAAAWSEAACRAKGIDPNAALAGEEWVAGPISTIRNLQLLLQALAANGQPQPVRWSTRPNGQHIAQVFPSNPLEALVWLGFRGEVWIEPDCPTSQGRIYREPQSTGALALVLGAGNISSIGPMDALYKLFVENQVVLLKMNPVNEYVGEFIERAFQPLIADGFLEVVYGGADLGAYLCEHSAIETIHITGSHLTHDAIAWGATAEEQQRRKAANDPRLTKPITAELGCVTPILVVPGPWSESDLKFQARHVAGMVAHNASFNCAAAKVVITARGWSQRTAFLHHLRNALSQAASRQAYYPGAQSRYQAFLERYPQAEPLGDRTDRVVPWTLIPDVPAASGEYALSQEAFCGVLAEVALEATDAPEFLQQAVSFANQSVWGSLSCSLLIDPVTQKTYASDLDTAIAQLRYGSVGVNLWSGMIYYLCSTTWGAFPGNSLADIGSGRGVVHNTYLFDHPQKSVVYAPFRIRPTPAWFPGHRNLRSLAQHLLQFEANPTWQTLLPVTWAALQG